MLTEEKINLNYTTFVTKLTKYGIYTDSMKEDVDFNEALRTASAFTSNETGGAYEGSLIEHITRIAILAFNINNLLAEEIRVPTDSLIKTCYLHQIAKVLMIKKSTGENDLSRGKKFSFVKNLPAIKMPEYSLFICAKYGVNLNEDEYEAILSTEKECDSQIKYFSNSLTQILGAAINLANAEKRLVYKLNSKK